MSALDEIVAVSRSWSAPNELPDIAYVRRGQTERLTAVALEPKVAETWVRRHGPVENQADEAGAAAADPDPLVSVAQVSGETLTRGALGDGQVAANPETRAALAGFLKKLDEAVQLLVGGLNPDPVADGQESHEGSSRCEGAGTPVRSSVEVAADSAAGSAGGPLASGRPAADSGAA